MTTGEKSDEPPVKSGPSSGRPFTPFELKVYGRAGIDADEAKLWADADIHSYAAEAFRKLGMNLEEAKRLQGLGLQGNTAARALELGLDLEVAARWHTVGFPLDQVESAQGLGLTPAIWSGSSRFEVQDVIALIEMGVEPNDLPRCSTLNTDLETLGELLDFVDVDQLVKWHYQHLPLKECLDALNDEASDDEVGPIVSNRIAWRELGVTLQDSSEFERLDVTAEMWSKVVTEAPTFNLRHASALLTAGVDPHRLAQFASMANGIVPVIGLVKAGATPRQMTHWLEMGLNLRSCEAAVREGTPVADVARKIAGQIAEQVAWDSLRLSPLAERCWRVTHLPPETIQKLLTAGRSPLDALEVPEAVLAGNDASPPGPYCDVAIIDPDSSPVARQQDGQSLPAAVNALVRDIDSPEQVAKVLLAFGFSVLWDDQRQREWNAMGSRTDIDGLLLEVRRAGPGEEPTHHRLTSRNQRLYLESGTSSEMIDAISPRDAIAACVELREVRPCEITDFSVSIDLFPNLGAFAALLEVVEPTGAALREEFDWSDDQLGRLENARTPDGVIGCPVFINDERYGMTVLHENGEDEWVAIPLGEEGSKPTPVYLESWCSLSSICNASMVSGTSVTELGLVTPRIVCEYSDVDETSCSVEVRRVYPHQRLAEIVKWLDVNLFGLEGITRLAVALLREDDDLVDSVTEAIEEDGYEVYLHIDAGTETAQLIGELTGESVRT